MISFIITKRHHIYQLIIEANSKQLKMSTSSNTFTQNPRVRQSFSLHPVAVKSTRGMYKVLTNDVNNIPILKREPVVPMLCLDYLPNRSKMTLDELAC